MSVPKKLVHLDSLVEHELQKVLQFEASALKTHALSLIPSDLLENNCCSCETTGQYKPDNSTGAGTKPVKCDLCFLQRLSLWFKNDFFSWVNSPGCVYCGGQTQFRNRYSTSWPTSGRPASSAVSSLYVIDVEDHLCSTCGSITKFPRHSDTSILLETRRGRCSEWAQVFTLICRAIGYRTRLVVDVTDHVWTEIYSSSLAKWVHIDACEAAVDQPLLYEKGWGKKLSYVVAVGIDDVQDVSWRYSADHNSLKSRRNPVTDKMLLNCVLNKRRTLIQHLSPESRNKILAGVITELAELMIEPTQKEDYGGRTSGDRQWISSRSEDGSNVAPKSQTILLTKYKSTSGSAQVKIAYSSASNKYLITGDSGNEETKMWQSLTYKAENIFRKEESDWKMSYLARVDGSKPGTIEWRLNGEQHNITKISLATGSFTKEKCTAIWEIENEDRTFTTSHNNVDNFTVEVPSPNPIIIIRVTLGSPPGSQELAWQFAQIFREKTVGAIEYSYGFTIHLN